MKQVTLLVFILLWQTVNADEIDQFCRAEWGSDYEMVNYCTKNQRTAKYEISAYSGMIRQNCENEWGSNYEMVLYCIKNQSNLANQPQDRITQNCRNEWGNNFEMVEYCITNQRTAKRTIEQSYGTSFQRFACEREWGSNYEMILYCIQN